MNCFDKVFLQDALRQTHHVLNLTIMYAKEHGKKIYLAFSGGKDSLVLNHIVKSYFSLFDQEYILSHNLTGIDERETYQFLVENFNWNGREKNSDKQCLMIAPPLLKFFDGLKIKKMLPTFSCRWCCDTCKHRNNKANEKNNIVLMGIRSGESNARKKRYDWFNQNTRKGNKKYKCIMDIDPKNKTLKVNPLLHWTDSDIWNYIELHNINLPQGYGNRTGRKGCYLCPFMSKKDLFKQWNSDIPFVNLYKKVMQEIIDGNHGEYRHLWKDVNIWVTMVWFLDTSKLNKKHRVIDRERFEKLEKAVKERKKTKMKDRNTDENSYLDYYYCYYYEKELKKDPWFLLRDEKWFKDLIKEGYVV